MNDSHAATGSSKVKWLTLAALATVYMVSYIDRQLLLILAEPIKRELQLSDTQIGLLGGFSFALFYTIAGVPIAWLADRWNRVRIIAVACALWSVFSAACGLAGSFAQLAVARMGVGIGEAGGTAPSFSILSDLFKPNERARAVALFSLGSPLGVLVGTAAGAALADAYGWRVAFYALGLPGVLLAMAVFFFVREPVRGLSDPGGASARSQLSIAETLRLYFSTRAVRLMTFGAGATAFVALGVSNWLPAFMMRSKGMTLSEISAYFSVVVSGSVLVGILFSGALSDWLGKTDRRAYARVPAYCLMIAIPFLAGAILVPDWRLSLALVAFPLAVTAGQVPPALALVHNSLPAAQRASATAIFLLVLNVTGIGFGPLVVGLISDYALEMGVQDSLGAGLLFLCAFLIVPILLLLRTSRALGQSDA